MLNRDEKKKKEGALGKAHWQGSSESGQNHDLKLIVTLKCDTKVVAQIASVRSNRARVEHSNIQSLTFLESSITRFVIL